jgi:addiction module HigA family antidote
MARTPSHPGEILSDELRELGISAVELARLIHVLANRVSQILSGKCNITADTALRLAAGSAPAPNCGSICSKRTTWSSPGNSLVRHSRRSSLASQSRATHRRLVPDCRSGGLAA